MRFEFLFPEEIQHTWPRMNSAEDGTLLKRVEEVERALASLNEKTTESSPDHSISAIAALRTRLTESTSGNRIAYKHGEALFQSDYGSSIGYQEQTLLNVFRGANDNIGLKDVSCKSTICKVTYQIANVDSLSSGGINSAKDSLINDISDGYENANLHIIHGADEYGNQVMYIQTEYDAL